MFVHNTFFKCLYLLFPFKGVRFCLRIITYITIMASKFFSINRTHQYRHESGLWGEINPESRKGKRRAK